ncbi:hypothetical protein RSAG8_09333, partial [Rhizoctonia solani AG-8 WAC10335]
MSSKPSGSKRKRTGRPSLGNLLHPGEWGNKRAKSGSPPASGASTPGTTYSNSPAPSHPSSRSPSPAGHPGPSIPTASSLNTASYTPVLPNLTVQSPHPSNSVPNSTRNSTGSAWTGLEQALRALRVTTKICPSLSLAVDDLTSCLSIFEAAAKNQRDYDELATGLKSMVDQLVRHLDRATSEGIITTITSIAEAIRKEIESINMHQSRSLPRRMQEASNVEDDLIRRYRRIEQLFRQLQGEASMSTWNTVDELRVEQHLKDLRPSKLARFNSKLSTEVSRRGCTKDTRTTILEGSIAWSENPDLAKVYWMNGMAGTGKTTIAYSLCERLEAGKQLAASFFCTRASPECREAKQIIPTIAYQLARRFAPFRYSLCQQLKQDPDISFGQLSDQFDLLLKRPLLSAKDKLSNNLVIVVDALDECSDPHIVELFLDLLFRSVMELPIKFFVTSRPEPAIRNKMMPESERSRSILYLHEIELSLVQADIELYLREELASIGPEDDDITELAEHAGNLFIYAATAVRYIRPVGKVVNSKARLTAILAVSAESQKKLSAIDALYTAILTAAIVHQEKSSFVPNDQIPELGEQIKANISEELFYMCRFWVDHLSETNPPDALVLLAHEFLLQRLLFWMEVMSLKNCMVTGILMITKLNTWLTQVHPDTRTNLLELASDAQGFVANYAPSPASAYTPHIYLSALPLSPPSSSVRSQYLPQFKGLIKVSGTILNKLGKAALGTWASTSSIRSATFSPSGDRIILGDDEGRISVQNAYDGKYIVHPFKAHKKVITSLGVSSDGMQIVSGSNDKTLSIWNARDGSLVSGPFKGHTNRVTSVAFSPDAAFIVSGSDDCTIGIWNAHNMATPMRSFTGHAKEVKSVAFSPDGPTTIFTLHGHTSAVTSVQFTPNGSYIVSGSFDNLIRIWNTSDGSLVRQLRKAHSGGITSIAVSPDGSRIVSGSRDRTICVWNMHSGELIAGPLEGHTASVQSVGFSGDGVRIMSASGDKTVRVWNAQGQMPQPEKDAKRGHEYYEKSTSRSQTHVAFRDQTERTKFHVWDLRTTTHVVVPTSAEIHRLQFSLDGTRIHSLHTPGTICTWDTQTAELLDGPHRFTTLEKWRSAACSVDGTRVVTCLETKAELWHVKSNRSIAVCETGSGYVQAIFSQDGSRFVTRDKRGSMSEVWDGDSGARVAGPFSVEVFDISPDGTYLCCWSGDLRLHLINVNTGKRIDLPPGGRPDSMIFTPDGLCVAVVHSNTIHIWNTRDQTVAAFDIPSMPGGAYSNLLECSSDGWLLLSRDHYGETSGFPVWRIHIDNPPFTTSPDGWILDGQQRPLIWVPTEIRKTFPGCNGVIISGREEALQSVDYGDMLVGADWSQCYINDSQPDVTT